MGLGESVCVESPLKLVGTWDLLLTQRALITSLGTLLLPRQRHYHLLLPVLSPPGKMYPAWNSKAQASL